MNYDPLWNPLTVGDVTIANRLVMAPMTRSRSSKEGIPNDLNAQYYVQRASNGLIISEGTQPSEEGQGYLLTPGIYTPEQVAGWRRITDAVHTAGGRMFIQLMHAGRVSHPDNTIHGTQSVAPSAIAAPGDMFTAEGLKPMPAPRALTIDDIRVTVQDFATAAVAAMGAGADGVEIHGGYGYLVHQFLSSNTNRRTDEYGGSVQNRIRFAVEVAAAIAREIGPGRVGIRLSPGSGSNGVEETDPREVYLELVRALAPLNLAYVHYVPGDEALMAEVRQAWPHTFIVNRAGADLPTRAQDVANGLADAMTVGALALANPDLVHRLRNGAELNEPDAATFYGGDHNGYTTYPTLATTVPV